MNTSLISATRSDNIQTESSSYVNDIQRQTPSSHDGAYQISASGFPEKQIGLSTISCDKKRTLTCVDIEDGTNYIYVANKLIGDQVITYSVLGQENGPASLNNKALVFVGEGQRL